MEGLLHLEIFSPEKEIFSGEVEHVTLPGTMGSFTILPQHAPIMHAPIISSLQAGTLSYVTKEGEHSEEIHGGFVEMNGNKVSVCVN